MYKIFAPLFACVSFYKFFTSDHSNSSSRLIIFGSLVANKQRNLSHSFQKKCIQFPCRFPLDWRTPIGYSFTLFLQLAALFSVMAIASYHLRLFASCCEYAIAFVFDIQENLHDLSADTKIYSGKLSAKQRVQLMRKLCGIMRFHAKAKRLSFKFLLIKLKLSYSTIYFELNFRLTNELSKLFSTNIGMFLFCDGLCITRLLLEMNTVCSITCIRFLSTKYQDK